MHRLSSAFVLGYHGCDRDDGERVLAGDGFKVSNNDYDWLGPGIYFWENNPRRGLEFAREKAGRKGAKIKNPFVVGAVIDLGLCLDVTTSDSIEYVRVAYDFLRADFETAGTKLPRNTSDRLRRNLDCAVMKRVHELVAYRSEDRIQTVKGLFSEGAELYPGAGFYEKTHVQIAVCDPACIKGVFRVGWPLTAAVQA